MKKTLVVFFILFSVYTAASSQECKQILIGEVVDFHDGTPLFGAVIEIGGSDRRVTTDFQGKFRVDQLCNGPLTLFISHPDCSSQFKEIAISGDSYTRITLEHHLEELGEVIVSEQRITSKTRSAQEQLIDKKVLERYSGSNLGDALKEVSGVSSLNTGNTIVKPVIQGLHSSRIIIMNNGVRMQDQEWGAEHAPNFDLNSVSYLTVIKGAAALKYGGDAIGGVIVAEPILAPAGEDLSGKTLLTGATNGRGGTITTTLQRSYNNGWYWKGQGSYKRFGDFETPDYVLSNTGMVEGGFSAAFGYRSLEFGFDAFYSYYNNEIGILRAAHNGNTSDLLRALNRDQPIIIEPFTYDINSPKQEAVHHLAKIKAYKRFEGKGKWNLQYDYQSNNRLEYDVRRGDRSNKPALDMLLNTHTLTSDFALDAITALNVNFGVRFMYQTNYPDPNTGVKRLIPDYERLDAGGFLTADYRISERWTIDAGIRYDFSRIDADKYYDLDDWTNRGYNTLFPQFEEEIFGNQILVNPVLDFNNISATVGSMVQLNSYEFLLNLSLGSRAPNPSELFSDGLHHSAAAIEEGDLGMESENSYKASLSFNKTKGSFKFLVEPYLNYVSGFIVLEPQGFKQTIRGEFPVWRYRQTDAVLLGIDLTASIEYNENWSSNHGLAYIYGDDLDRETPLIDVPAPAMTNKVVYRNPVLNDLEIGLRSNLVLEQTRFPDNNFDINIIENGEIVSRTVDLSTPPPAYHLLGMDASVNFDINNNSSLEVSLIGNNLLNTSYRDYLNRLRFFADDLGRNIQLQLKINY